MLKKIFSITLLGLLIGCAGPSQEILLLSEVKQKSKSICISNPFVYLQVFDSRDKYLDEENQKKMIEFIINEAKDSLEKQFEVITTDNPIDSQYYEFGNQLYDYMKKLENTHNWPTIPLPVLIEEEINKTECDLNLFIFNTAFYRTKASMAKGIAGSIALGVLTLGNATMVPNKSISTMFVAIYSKKKKCVIYFDNEEDNDLPILEINAKNQIRTLLEDFIEAPTTLPIK